MEEKEAQVPEYTEEEEEVKAAEASQRIKDKLQKLGDKLETLKKEKKEKKAEVQKKRKREQRKEEESKLAPFQKKDPEFNPVLRHQRNKKKARKEDPEYDDWLKLLEEGRIELCQFLESILPQDKRALLIQLQGLKTTDLIARFKNHIVPMWRLNMIGVPVRIMLSMAKFSEKDFVGGKKSLDEFKMKLSELCKIVDQRELKATETDVEEDLGEL